MGNILGLIYYKNISQVLRYTLLHTASVMDRCKILLGISARISLFFRSREVQHPDRSKTQMMGSYNMILFETVYCQVEPTGGSHTGEKINKVID